MVVISCHTELLNYSPLRDSILSVPSSLCQLARLSSPLIKGLYSHPLLKSGNQRAEEAAVDPSLSQPYWCPTTVPTSQLAEAELADGKTE